MHTNKEHFSRVCDRKLIKALNESFERSRKVEEYVLIAFRRGACESTGFFYEQGVRVGPSTGARGMGFMVFSQSLLGVK